MIAKEIIMAYVVFTEQHILDAIRDATNDARTYMILRYRQGARFKTAYTVPYPPGTRGFDMCRSALWTQAARLPDNVELWQCQEVRDRDAESEIRRARALVNERHQERGYPYMAEDELDQVQHGEDEFPPAAAPALAEPGNSLFG